MREDRVPFSMVLAARPVSSQASSGTTTRYQAQLAREATGWFARRARLTGDLYMRIVWFHRDRTAQDADNIAKRISDSLIGIVYDDDLLISKYLIERIRYDPGVTTLTREIPSPIYNKLVSLMARNEKHMLYVEVGVVTHRRFFFEPFTE